MGRPGRARSGCVGRARYSRTIRNSSSPRPRRRRTRRDTPTSTTACGRVSNPASLRIGPLGYARHAQASYAIFAGLKQAGVIARDIRFQVCMATPLAHLWAYVDPDHQPVVEQPLLAGFANEIAEILAVVPAAELAIQWDMPHDILSIEGNRKLHVDVSRAGLQQRWSRLVEKIPAAAELGFHFCYGDSGGKHSIEPRDTKVMSDFANDLTAAIARPISYFHFPVPIERSDEGFFAPLKTLNLTHGTELFLGLVHPQDGIEGARRRIAVALDRRVRFRDRDRMRLRPPRSRNHPSAASSACGHCGAWRVTWCRAAAVGWVERLRDPTHV